MKLQILAACAALASLTAGAAFAADSVTAKLSAPVAQNVKFIAGGAIFKCEGDTCVALAPTSTTFAASTWGPRQAVIGQPALAYMIQMMRGVIAGGTGGRANVPGYDLAGKTGTTSDYRDAWFVGYTGGFVTAVWVGKDDNRPMRKVTGGAAPAAIWKAYMTQALPRLKVQPIPGGDFVPETPSTIDQIIDGVTGLFKSDKDEPPPSEFEDRPPPREQRRREEPQY